MWVLGRESCHSFVQKLAPNMFMRYGVHLLFLGHSITSISYIFLIVTWWLSSSPHTRYSNAIYYAPHYWDVAAWLCKLMLNKVVSLKKLMLNYLNAMGLIFAILIFSDWVLQHGWYGPRNCKTQWVLRRWADFITMSWTLLHIFCVLLYYLVYWVCLLSQL